MGRKKAEPVVEVAEVASFYIVLNGLLNAVEAQAVRDNLRDFSVRVVGGSDEIGATGTALVMGVADAEWFKTNRPHVTAVDLTGSKAQVLSNLYGLFGRTLPDILQLAEPAVAEPVILPASADESLSAPDAQEHTDERAD